MSEIWIDVNQLPAEVREKLAELDLELSEGDITQKGYEKKRTRLLVPYLNFEQSAGPASPSTRAKRRVHRRVTRNESRYHSEVRTEAVQQALAAMKNRVKPSFPMPSKRSSSSKRGSNAQSSRGYRNNLDSPLNESSGGDTRDHVVLIPSSRQISLGRPLNHQSSTDSASNTSPSAANEPSKPLFQNIPPRIVGVQEVRDLKEHRKNKYIRDHRHNPSLGGYQRPLQSKLHNDKRKSYSNNLDDGSPSYPSPSAPSLQLNQIKPRTQPHNLNNNLGEQITEVDNIEKNSSLDDTCSSNERPPEKPPQRISSRSECSNMKQLAEVLQNIPASYMTEQFTPLAQTSQNNSAKETSLPRQGSSPTSSENVPEYDHVYGQPDSPPGSRLSTVSSESYNTGTGKWKVSAKIQQLLNTLKKPKKRPLHDFYVDDETDLEMFANQLDPKAPKPEGSTMLPAVGEPLSVVSGLPKSLEVAIQRYGSATFKAPAITVLDTTGKISPALTYGKLLSRSRKIAYNLLNKFGGKGLTSDEQVTLKSGDRIALVYPNNDPIGFVCAFYGCLTAGIVPVPIEVPVTRRDAGSQQIGFLLGSCNVSYALTSDACYKGLPKVPGLSEIHTFKGWPHITWLIPDSWSKPPKDWSPPPRISEDASAFIEYTLDKDGSMKGVCVTRNAMISHCRSLTAACGYSEGDVMVCVLDFKRDVGLWHSVLSSILNGMHIIFIPYSLMKINPSSWMLMITKYKASIAICKSRDLHWGLLATKDHKDVNLCTLRLLLVADGSNPWSLSSCDQFINVFHSRGLRPDAMCPCAASPEGLTVAIRRPGRTGIGATGRGVLSMSALSHGVIRVDQENSLTSLTLQDCGHILPETTAAVVKLNGSPYLCKTDEVGEICISNKSTGSCYWGLKGLTNNIFRMQPLNSDGIPFSESQVFVRTGLIGFMGPGSLVFVCGTRDGLMQVSGRKHNTDDIIATVLAVEPMKFVYRGRIAVFSIKVLRDERICVIAEQRPDCTEEESFQWMSRVLQAVDSIHQVGIYCLSLVPPNNLPKTSLGGIHLSEVKRQFLDGTLHPANVLMCPHICVTNLPKPREVHSDIGPASVMVGNIVQGNRLAVASGRDLGFNVDEPLSTGEGDLIRKYQYISDILKWRAATTPDHNMFTLLNNKGFEAASITCLGLHKRAERVACLLLEKGKLNTGDHVALIYPPDINLICAFYGCLYIGVVPVTIRPPHPQNLNTTLPIVRTIVDVSKSVLMLSTQPVSKLLKSKEASNVVDIKSWPPILDTDDLPKKKLSSIYRAPTSEMIAYLDFSVSTTGMLAGIKVSHAAVTSLCRSMKLACELYPSRHIALCLDPYCGLGFVLWTLNSVYSGHHSLLIPPSEVEANPALWLTAVSMYKVRDTFCSYGVLELCTKGLGTDINSLKVRLNIIYLIN